MDGEWFGLAQPKDPIFLNPPRHQKGKVPSLPFLGKLISDTHIEPFLAEGIADIPHYISLYHIIL